MRLRALALIGLASSFACADTPTGDDEVASTSDASTTDEADDDASTTTDDDASTTDDASTDDTVDTVDTRDATDTDDTTDDTTGDGDSYPTCTQSCDAPADCAQPLDAYDEDNWGCISGGCVWLGCKQGECEGTDICHPTPGVPTCLSSCSDAADCDLGIGPYIAENYECDAGACVFTGCSSDAQCQVFGDQVCVAELELPVCLESCETVDDCGTGQPAFDADNYVCENQVCVYQGCMPGECADGQTCVDASP
jgi:hypothetical protein